MDVEVSEKAFRLKFHIDGWLTRVFQSLFSYTSHIISSPEFRLILPQQFLTKLDLLNRKKVFLLTFFLLSSITHKKLFFYFFCFDLFLANEKLGISLSVDDNCFNHRWKTSKSERVSFSHFELWWEVKGISQCSLFVCSNSISWEERRRRLKLELKASS